MSFNTSLIVKMEGWEGCLIFEVEVISVLGVPWLGLGLGPFCTGTSSNSHLDHSFPALTELVPELLGLIDVIAYESGWFGVSWFELKYLVELLVWGVT